MWHAWDQHAQVKAILTFTIESASCCFFVHYICSVHAIIVKLDDVRTRNRNFLNSVTCSSIHCSCSFDNTASNDSFKWQMIIILWPLSVLSCFVLLAKWLFCKTTWYLVLAKIFWIPKHWYAWQLVYCHDVIETNVNFNFLGVGNKLPPVLLQIEVALLNKYLSQNININNLFINIESWSTFVKLVGNSVLRKTILSRMWRNLEFPRDQSIFFRLFLFLFVSSSLVCVVS